MKVYLAGKISHGDWRKQYVKGLDEGDIGDSPQGSRWPVLLNAIADGMHYTGPYFSDMGCGGHGQCHGDNRHGNGIGLDFGDMHEQRSKVAGKCLTAVKNSDVVIVRLNHECYGTMFEVGFDIAQGIRVVLCFEEVGYDYFSPKNDFWLANQFCSSCVSVDDAIYRLKGEIHVDDFYDLLNLCESEIEKVFFTEARSRRLDIKPQVQINEYRVDFANEKLKVVIEIDGHQFHSSKEQIRRDLQRQRSLEMCGWRVHRFSGSEVYANVGNCVEQCITLMDVRRKELQLV